MDRHRSAWRKSTLSQLSGCVEVAVVDGRVAVRDSKARLGPVLVFDATEWTAFLDGVRDGQFNRPKED